MFNKLTQPELEAMVAYVNEFAGDGGGYPEHPLKSENIKHILRFWETNKKSLYQLFGKELILTKRVSFSESEAEIKHKLNDLLYQPQSKGSKFFNSYNRHISQLPWATYMKANRLIGTDNLHKNVYSGSDFEIPYGTEGKVLKIRNGCKVIKALGKISEALGIEGFEEFRLGHSLCLNQKKTAGEICLSIHPFDYMTMSDNACSWDSCMSWMAPGDYRQGTVEMMNSPCVVVAYLKSSQDMDFVDGFKWNSKKWRQLYIVDSSIIMSIKQYPYDNDELNGVCLKWLRDLAEKNAGWGPYTTNMCQIRNCSTNVLAELNTEVCFSFDTGYMYNDIYSLHTAYVAQSCPGDVYIHYSGEAECMVCGEEIDIDDVPTHSLTCSSCECHLCCTECGEHLSRDSAVWFEDEPYCECCYDNFCEECDACGKTFYNDLFYTVKVYHLGNLAGYSTRICSDCSRSNKYGKIQTDAWLGGYYIDTKDLTEEGYILFDIPEEEEERYKQENNVTSNEEN